MFLLLVCWYNKPIIKLDWSKHKRTLWIAFAIVFLVALYLLKTPSIFKNTINSVSNNKDQGLTYSNVMIGDLVNKDTDGDGIPDWEESLWGTDPTKKETTPGVPDVTAIEKLKVAEGKNESTGQQNANLTETDKFSQELFATITALNQNGVMDQATADKISESLVEHVQNSVTKKIYTLSDIKTIKDNSAASMLNYDKKTGVLLYNKYPMNEKIVSVLKESLLDNGEVDATALLKLDPIIVQIKGIITGMASMSVPSKLAVLHLELINAFEAVSENLNDIKLIDSDPIVAMGAINQYLKNNEQLDAALVKLGAEVTNNKN